MPALFQGVKDVFGQSVIYEHASDSSQETISAVFEEKSFEVEVGLEVEVITKKPFVFLELSDLSSAPDKGDRISVNSTW